MVTQELLRETSGVWNNAETTRAFDILQTARYEYRAPVIYIPWASRAQGIFLQSLCSIIVGPMKQSQRSGFFIHLWYLCMLEGYRQICTCSTVADGGHGTIHTYFSTSYIHIDAAQLVLRKKYRSYGWRGHLYIVADSSSSSCCMHVRAPRTSSTPRHWHEGADPHDGGFRFWV